MYTEGQEKAKVGIVAVDIHGKSYRLRFVYPEGCRHQFTIAKVTPEGWTTAIKAAQLINRDIDLGDFDSSYARYSPSHARKLEIAQAERKKEYDLKELWEAYKEANGNRVAETTKNKKWKIFDRYLEAINPSLLMLDQANSFVSYLTNKYSSGTLQALFTGTLHPAINLGVRQGKIKSNPYIGVKIDKTLKKVIECFDANEVKAIITAFYDDRFVPNSSNFPHSYYAYMIEFLALTGCRPSECHALTWDDIKVKGEKTFISFSKAYSGTGLRKRTKNDAIRLFPCNTQLKNMIASIPRIKNENNLICPSIYLDYVNQNNFRARYWKPVVEGLVKQGKVDKYLKPYCLRHSFITRLIREGVDIATVASLSGNSPEIIMKNYLASRKEFDLPEL